MINNFKERTKRDLTLAVVLIIIFAIIYLVKHLA